MPTIGVNILLWTLYDPSRPVPWLRTWRTNPSFERSRSNERTDEVCPLNGKHCITSWPAFISDLRKCKLEERMMLSAVVVCLELVSFNETLLQISHSPLLLKLMMFLSMKLTDLPASSRIIRPWTLCYYFAFSQRVLLAIWKFWLFIYIYVYL